MSTKNSKVISYYILKQNHWFVKRFPATEQHNHRVALYIFIIYHIYIVLIYKHTILLIAAGSCQIGQDKPWPPLLSAEQKTLW